MSLNFVSPAAFLSAKLIDGINRSESRRRALVLFCFVYLNADARVRYMHSSYLFFIYIYTITFDSIKYAGDKFQFSCHLIGLKRPFSHDIGPSQSNLGCSAKKCTSTQ